MAGSPGITAYLKDLRDGIQKIKTEASAAASNVRDLNESLKVDPSNVKVVKERFQALNEQLKASRILAQQYEKSMLDIEEKEKSVTGTEDEQRKAIEALEREHEKYRVQLEKTKDTISSLEKMTSNEAQTAMIMNAAHERSEKIFGSVQQKAQKFADVIVSLASKFKILSSELFDTSANLTTLSKRYDTSVEEIQNWNNALKIATNQSDVYTNSLNTMVKGMSQVASGRGVAYRTALKGIGLSYKELAALSTSEQFERIVEALSQVTDQAERLDYAQQLLGESGQSIAGIFNEEGASLEAFLEQAKQFGVISNETAEALAENEVELDLVKQELKAAFGEVLVASLPILREFADLIRNTVTPVVRGLGNLFENAPWLAKGLVFLATALVLVPKIIGVVKTFFTVFSARSAIFSAGGLKMIAIIGGIAVALTAVLALMSLFSNRAKDTLDSVTSTAASITGLNNAVSQTESNTQLMQQSSTTEDVNFHMDISATGDTPIDDENAKKVADVTVDQIQKILGGKIGK